MIEIQIQAHVDRENVIIALVENGYTVKIEERKKKSTWKTETQYWIIADRRESEGTDADSY